MNRPVTADHILFDECIRTFRPDDSEHTPLLPGLGCCHLLLSFPLTESLQLGEIRIHPSHVVHLQGPYSAYISRVDNPNGVNHDEAHLFGTALATIISFATLTACKSTRNSYIDHDQIITESSLQELAMLHPILVAGPGAEQVLSEATRRRYGRDIAALTTKLYLLPYKDYVLTLQALRLVYLSLINKREDFGLAYLLIVSAIEVIAQLAITKNEVLTEEEDQKVWNVKAQSDADFAKLLKNYEQTQKAKTHLTKRYIKFIEKFSPFEKWEEIIPHRNQELTDILKEISPSSDNSHLIAKHWFETYPNELSPEDIRKIIGSSYEHRSRFVHSGIQPPHNDPNPFSRFFQEVYELNPNGQIKIRFDGRIKKFLLPNYELLIGIARNAISKWIVERAAKAIVKK